MSEMNKHIIAFRERKILIENPGENQKDPIILISLLGQIGAALSPEVKGKITPEIEKEIVDALTPWAVKTFGLGKKWLSVYDDPQLLLAKTPEDLLVDQICLYMWPSVIEEIKERDGVSDFWTINGYRIKKVLEPIGKEEFSEMSKTLMESKVALGPERSEVLDWFLENPEYLRFPGEIPMKETLCRVLLYYPYPVSSPTDILRFALYLSGNDIKYPGKYWLLDLNGSKRKKILKYLDDLANRKRPEFLALDMWKYRKSWLTLSKLAHPSPAKYPGIAKVLGMLFGKDKSWKSLGWGNQIRRAYDSNNPERVLELYLQRPGELVRHFDSLLRRFEGGVRDQLMEDLISLNIPTKLLLGLSYYYDMREYTRENRSFKDLKGRRIPIPHYLPELSPDVVEMVQYYLKSAISKKYLNQESLESKAVFLDLNPDLELNLSERSSQSGSTESGLQGIKIDIPETGILRFFLQWIDQDGSHDLDLHAQGVIKVENEPESLIALGWNTSFAEEIAVHSGDIRMQKGDCSEYITVFLDKAREKGLKKLVISGHDYNDHVLGKSCETYIGYSVIGKEKTKGPWSPLTCNTPFRVRLGETNEEYMCLFIVDLENHWLKIITEPMPQSTFTKTSDFITHFIPKTLTLGELVKMNVEARGGKVVETKEESTMIIDKDTYQEWVNTLLK
jgi:hypothetical protein